MTLNDNILPVVDEVKDLGMIVDSHLSFDGHITKTVARAFTRVNLIHKCFTSRDAATLWRAFVVYVRPLLVYIPHVFGHHIVWVRLTASNLYNVQDAQLSQIDRAAGSVIVFAKSRTLELGDNDLRTL